MNSHYNNLSELRLLLKKNKIDAYIIPSTDPHLGEYIPDHWRIIAWLTGFTGSAATVVVTDAFAGLWTDSRYFIQAQDQLADTGFVLMKQNSADKKDFIAWIDENLATGSKIALDGRIFSIERLRKLRKVLEGKNVSFDTECDLVPELWSERPPMPASVAFDHPVGFCGKDRSLKIAEVRDEMRKLSLDYHLLTSIDDIMWLLNIRGSDIKFSPLFTSFAIVGNEQILLFADENRIPFKLASVFDKIDIVMLPYEEIAGMLSSLPAGSTILITLGKTSAGLFDSIPQGMIIKEDVSIPTRLKAIKNKTEVENIGRVMVKDGVALTKFFYWIEHNQSSDAMSELSLGEKLEGLRSEQEHFLGPSFSSIIAFNEHGALPHYSATNQSDSALTGEGILLVDSGGQYLDGTTDITRTITLGNPTTQQKRDFTLVLKGTIALAESKFPSGTRGYQLDILARKALWENGYNYGHGTGHGVGFCLNVHEGPQSISPVTGEETKTIIEPGMLISDEPAIYREGEYGIRTENLILCREDEVTRYGEFLKFDTLSLCYIDKSLIDISLMDKIEIEWLNSYHREVFEKISSYLSENEKGWLADKTSGIFIM